MKQLEIAKELIYAIAHGDYPAGSSLPSARALCLKYGVTAHYARYALSELQTLGIAQGNKRGGTTVVRRPLAHELAHCSNRVSRLVLLLNHCRSDYSFSHIFFNPQLLETMRYRLCRAGFELVVCEIGEFRSSEDYLRFVAAQIHGNNAMALAVISGGKNFKELVEQLFRLHDNVFIFNRGSIPLDESMMNVIGINNCADGMQAANLAMANGAKRLIYCSPQPQSIIWSIERRRGVSLGLRKLYPLNTFLQVHAMASEDDFPLESPQPDLALIADNDETAVKYIHAGRKRGLEPGRDYKLIGFGNDSRYTEFELTTFAPDLELIAEMLTDSIIDSATGCPRMIHSMQISSKLIRRRTL